MSSPKCVVFQKCKPRITLFDARAFTRVSQGEQKMAAETGNLAFLRQNAFFLFKKILNKKNEWQS